MSSDANWRRIAPLDSVLFRYPPFSESSPAAPPTAACWTGSSSRTTRLRPAPSTPTGCTHSKYHNPSTTVIVRRGKVTGSPKRSLHLTGPRTSNPPIPRAAKNLQAQSIMKRPKRPCTPKSNPNAHERLNSSRSFHERFFVAPSTNISRPHQPCSIPGRMQRSCRTSRSSE